MKEYSKGSQNIITAGMDAWNYRQRLKLLTQSHDTRFEKQGMTLQEGAWTKNEKRIKMITLDVKYFSESDYTEAQEFIKKLREMFPVFFHEESCNKIHTIQLSSNDKRWNKMNNPKDIACNNYEDDRCTCYCCEGQHDIPRSPLDCFVLNPDFHP